MPRPGAACGEGLEREDLFTVVFDQVMTDTARYADVRAAGDDVPRAPRDRARATGPIALQDRAAVDRAGGRGAAEPRRLRASSAGAWACSRDGRARDATRAGGGDLASSPHGPDRRARCREGGVAAARRAAARRSSSSTCFPSTPDGKVHLVPEELDREAPLGLYAIPGPEPPALPARAHLARHRQADQLDPRRAAPGRGPLEIHPDDARAARIADGDRVRVCNDARRGALPRPRRPTTSGRASSSLPKGLWATTPTTAPPRNALVPRHPGRPRRRRLLQRRPRRGRSALTEATETTEDTEGTEATDPREPARSLGSNGSHRDHRGHRGNGSDGPEGAREIARL